MSKVKIKGNASGTGVLTIEAPNTNDDSTITLPDGTGELIQADASDNVGIGVTPSYRLHVETSVDGDFASLIHNTDADNGQGLMIRAGADAGEAILSVRNQASSEKFKVLADGRGLSQFTAKAWVNFNGLGSVAIRDSHNISSITDGGTGDFKQNFTNAMSNVAYAIVGSVTGSGNTTNSFSGSTTTYAHMFVWRHDGVAYDKESISMAVFGD